ncbi:myogenesis-regulating glycosidase-like [Mercenaria mercenaria]|uniref:myogenesis-regulating glycosidase-like n=1 Tax=Mercenaria mercenaria TaxID=6596 RepID=UPI00234F2A64|nr:myogenesis-regulating glycosidase-like [Mercenaria mercenaria]
MGKSKSVDFVDVPLSNSTLPGESDGQPNKFYTSTKFRLIIVIVAISILILGLIIGLAVESKKNNALKSKVQMLQKRQLHKASTVPTQVPPLIAWPLQLGQLTVDKTLSFSLRNGSSIKSSWKHSFIDLSALTPTDCSSNARSHLCLEWENERKLNISLSPQALDDGSVLECYNVEWVSQRDSSQILTDCFNVATAHWYGGYEDYHQYWPFDKNIMPLSPYVSNDAFKEGIGNVLERYFISSRGIGILLDNDIPLYFSLNNPVNGSMCFTAKYERYPFFNKHNSFPKLSYKICHAQNVKDVHKKMSASFIQRPKGIPHEDLFRYPIWSTWAQYHYDINQSTVLEFTNDVQNKGFSCSQIEIDDNWTPHYGDFFFDDNKFPNATNMIARIKENGCAVTAWVHPFFNIDGSYFKEANAKQYLLRQVDSDVPVLTKWWDGNMTGVLDVSNKNATDWYLDKLNKLKHETQLDSFKFDAGELSWLPNIYDASDLPNNPCENYPKRYVEMAARADLHRRQEVRSAYKTQQYPIFVRQIDKVSAWGHNNALASIIPGAFTFGILGYPFVLPDMIGGNAYDSRFPDSELFVRWIQLNTFLPSMQLSVVPWDERFNSSDIDVVQIARKFTGLHTNISDIFIKFANLSVLTGEPIIRPLWWIDPVDKIALTCEDEFLVGDEFLVAPILNKGARLRDIYFPYGSWLDMLQENSTVMHSGPRWVRNYSVQIDEIAYFKNMK